MNNMDFLCLLPFPHVCKKILSYFFHTVLSYTFLLGKSNYEKHAPRVSQVIAASTLRFGRC